MPQLVWDACTPRSSSTQPRSEAEFIGAAGGDWGRARSRSLEAEDDGSAPISPCNDPATADGRVRRPTDPQPSRAEADPGFGEGARGGQTATVTEALRAAARHVEEHKASLARNSPEMPIDEERMRLVAEVSVLRHELDSLVAASETAGVYRLEVEAVVGELKRRGLTLSPEVAQAVADAFHQGATPPKAAPTRRSPQPIDQPKVVIWYPMS